MSTGETTRPRANAAVAVFCLSSSVLISLIAIALVPALTLIAKELGGDGDSALVAQLIMTLPAIFMIFGASLSGFVTERIGRRHVALICLGVYTISGTAGLYLSSLEGLVISRVILGFFGGALLTTGYATIGEYFEGSQRHWMLGAISTTGSLSSVVVLWFGGGFVDDFGWRAPFAVFFLGLVIFPIAWIGMRRGLPPGASEKQLSWTPVTRLWPFYVLVTLYTVGMYMPSVQGPFLLSGRGETSADVISKAIAVSSLTGALGAFFYGLMRRWMNFSAMFTYISVALAVGMLLAVSSADSQIFVYASLIMGLALGIIEPTVASEVLGRTPEILHDRAVGISIAALFLGQFLNPLVVKPLRDIGGAPFAFTAVGAAFGLAAVAFLIAFTLRRRAA